LSPCSKKYVIVLLGAVLVNTSKAIWFNLFQAQHCNQLHYSFLNFTSNPGSLIHKDTPPYTHQTKAKQAAPNIMVLTKEADRPEPEAGACVGSVGALVLGATVTGIAVGTTVGAPETEEVDVGSGETDGDADGNTLGTVLGAAV
jgi:hypothetical protein